MISSDTIRGGGPLRGLVLTRLRATLRVAQLALVLGAIGPAAYALDGAATQSTASQPSAGTKPSTLPDAATQPADLPAAPPTQEVQALVADLSSDDFTTRQNSQKKLEGMGIAIEPQLRWCLNGKLDDEARARVQSALRHIQQNQQFGPSIITLHYQNAPLFDVLQDFAKQADADLGIHRPRLRQITEGRRITINVDHVSFWTAMKALEDASGLHPRPGEGDGRLVLDDMGGWIAFRGDRGVVAGPCLVMPVSGDWSIVYANNASNLSLHLMAVVEPKLRVTGSFNPHWLKECVDDRGHSLVPTIFQPSFYGGGRQWYFQLATNLTPTPGMGNRIARLRGELTFNVQTDSEVIAIDDLSNLKNLTRTVNGTAITLEKFTNENNQYQLQITIARPNDRWDLNQQMVQSLQILDEHDQALQQISSLPRGMRPNEMGLTMTYVNNMPNVGPPKKLRWELTTEARPMTVPFELDNLELPGSMPAR